MPNIDDPPPPMTWNQVLAVIATCVAAGGLAAVFFGSWMVGILTTLFFALLVVTVDNHNANLRKRKFLEQADADADGRVDSDGQHIEPRK